MGNIIPFPSHSNERPHRLSSLQYESINVRWPIRHTAMQRGDYAYSRAFSPNLHRTVEANNALGVNVVNIATQPEYQGPGSNPQAQATATPVEQQLASEPTEQPPLDANAIRKYIDEVA